MSNESVCQVSRSWLEVGSFHTRFVVRFMIFYSVSPEYLGYTLVDLLLSLIGQNILLSLFYF
jgi:hypothetical protein